MHVHVLVQAPQWPDANLFVPQRVSKTNHEAFGLGFRASSLGFKDRVQGYYQLLSDYQMKKMEHEMEITTCGLRILDSRV